jgi:quercetin dioxygenase-like cupin family protein
VKLTSVVLIGISLALPSALLAQDKKPAKAVITPAGDVQWKSAGVQGVETAVVKGDMTKGASHFYLKYAAGFSAPVHYHSPNHFVTTVAGNLVLIVGGKEHSLPPGSYFALTGKALHAARCEGKQDCVMFVDARGKWDVVVPKARAGK